MALYWIYVFDYDPKAIKDDKFEEDGSVDYSPGQKSLYAPNEREARRMFSRKFGYEAGDLIERKRW